LLAALAFILLARSLAGALCSNTYRRIVSFLRNILIGALGGLGVAALCLGIGAVRVGIALATGGHVSPLTAADFRVGVFYMAAFALAGAFVGAASPWVTGKRSQYAIGMSAGVIVTLLVTVAMTGGLTHMPFPLWLMAVGVGCLFGAAFVSGWRRV
jgi:hypothetical protein